MQYLSTHKDINITFNVTQYLMEATIWKNNLSNLGISASWRCDLGEVILHPFQRILKGDPG